MEGRRWISVGRESAGALQRQDQGPLSQPRTTLKRAKHFLPMHCSPSPENKDSVNRQAIHMHFSLLGIHGLTISRQPAAPQGRSYLHITLKPSQLCYFVEPVQVCCVLSYNYTTQSSGLLLFTCVISFYMSIRVSIVCTFPLVRISFHCAHLSPFVCKQKAGIHVVPCMHVYIPYNNDRATKSMK